MALLSSGEVNLFVVILAVSFVMAITWADDGTQLHHQDGSQRDLVRSEEHGDGSCSYVLTVPKACSVSVIFCFYFSQGNRQTNLGSATTGGTLNLMDRLIFLLPGGLVRLWAPVRIFSAFSKNTV